MTTTKTLRAAFLLLITVFLLSVQASANSYQLKEVAGKTIGIPYNTGDGYPYRGNIKIDEKYTVDSIKYDLKKLKASYAFNPETNTVSPINIETLKTGTSTLTFRLKQKQTGKIKTFKVKVYSYPYEKAPIKSITFNGKKPARIEYNRRYATLLTQSNKKGKLAIKLRKGWKIKSVKKRTAKGKLVKVSLSGKVKIAKKEYLIITLKNTKGMEILYQIYGTLEGI